MSKRQIEFAFDSAESQRVRDGAMVRSQEIARMSGDARLKAALAFRDQMIAVGIPASNVYFKMMNSLIWTAAQSRAWMAAPDEWNIRNAADRGLFY